MMDGLKVLSACLNLVPKFSSQLAAPLIHLVRAIIELRDDVSKERFGPTRMDNFFKVKFKKPSIFKVDFLRSKVNRKTTNKISIVVSKNTPTARPLWTTLAKPFVTFNPTPQIDLLDNQILFWGDN